MSPTHTLSDFDFELPPELIAQHPAAERSASRLLDASGAAPVDRVFRELPDLLRDGDLVVVNDTRVIRARLFGRKASGGAVEVLVERVLRELRAAGPCARQQGAEAGQPAAPGRCVRGRGARPRRRRGQRRRRALSAALSVRAACAARAPWPRAAAAVHRACRRRRGRRALPDRVRGAPRRRRRADRGAAFRCRRARAAARSAASAARA